MAIKTAKQQLCDLYNAANPTLPHALTVDDFRTGTRGARDPIGESLANFVVSVGATDESLHFTGSISFVYRRMPVGFTTQYIEDKHSAWADDATLIARLNSDLQVQYPNDELGEDESGENGSFTIKRSEGETAQHLEIIVTIANHLKFLDTEITYTIYEAVEKTDLSTADGELDDFN